MKTAQNNSPLRRRAFSLLEVMIAIAIFFLTAFAILSLISSSLANARRLQRPLVDAGPVLATYANTNILEEGTYSGSMADILGDAYRDYHWTAEIQEVANYSACNASCNFAAAAIRFPI